MKIHNLSCITLCINTSIACAAALNDTGIDWGGNYSSGNNSTCTSNISAPQDCHQGRDATIDNDSDGHAGFSFTAINSTGSTVSPGNHACVKDNVTDLMWEVKTDDGGLRDKVWSYTWYNSNAATNGGNLGSASGGSCYTSGRCDTEKFVADVNATGLCNCNAWQLPTKEQLRSIVDYSRYNPSIDTTYFPNTLAEWFWSASPFALSTDDAWIVGFSYGYDYNYYRSYASRARLVCAGQVLSFALSVAKTGNGAGGVSSNPAGINCGAVCAANFTQNSSVTLTATPNTGSVFALWSGACTGTATTCTVTMDAAKSTTATFNLVVANPSVVTNAPSVITATSARLSGTVTPNGAATTTSFNFGPTTAYGTNIVATPATIAATAAATNVSADKTGLTCGSTYHYQVKAVNSAGTTVGTDKAFTTNVCPRDLIVTNITLNPAKPVAGTVFNAVVTVKNQGTSATAASKLKLWPHLATIPVCTTAASKMVDIAALAAGASVNINVTGLISNLIGGNTFRAFADGTCIIGETNETNNHRTLNYRIGGRLPDLIITSITLTPAAPARNAVFNAAITVKNQGNTFTDTNYLDVWTNQATDQTCGAIGDTWIDVGMLTAGASRVITVTGLNAGATAGAKTLRAFVDSWCEAVESNEANNQLTKAYTVQ